MVEEAKYLRILNLVIHLVSDERLQNLRKGGRRKESEKATKKESEQSRQNDAHTNVRRGQIHLRYCRKSVELEAAWKMKLIRERRGWVE